ncbi:MAG: hypothetical protein KAI73_12345 [Rhodospirillaceae bacterium]|nr:hypothetical protein [Rhodospirillaceae bacterium]
MSEPETVRQAEIVPIGAEKQLAELNEILEFAIQQHGANSDAAKLLQKRIEDIHLNRNKMAQQLDTAKSIPTDIQLTVEKGAVLYIVIGGVLIVALLGSSTLFLGMLAAKWDTF